MRKINEIILHCSATEAGKDYSVEDIREWHKKRGFSDIGYHYIIHLDGSVEHGRSLLRVGAHCLGHNKHSVGICYIGGLIDGHPANTLTHYQIEALSNLLRFLLVNFRLDFSAVHLHNEYAKKACPCFDKRYLNQVIYPLVSTPPIKLF